MSTGMAKVFITRPIPENGIEMLKRHFEVFLRENNSPISREELRNGVKDCDALLSILTDKVDAEIMDLNPDLKIISNYAVGYNNIDVAEATKRGIAVGNTPDVLTQSTAEHAMALVLSLAKRIHEGDKIMREDSFLGWGPMYMLGAEIYNKTVGIVGCGRIGACFAGMMSKAFKCTIIYTDLNSNENIEKETGAEKVELEKLLRESDIVSLHVPLMPETARLVGEKELNMMKKTAYLINTARGPVVDEKALLNALKEGRIAGAGLDVFEEEPRRLSGLEELDNIIMTPHTGSATWEARKKMAYVAAQNIIGVLVDGQEPVSIINTEVFSRD